VNARRQSTQQQFALRDDCLRLACRTTHEVCRPGHTACALKGHLAQKNHESWRRCQTHAQSEPESRHFQDTCVYDVGTGNGQKLTISRRSHRASKPWIGIQLRFWFKLSNSIHFLMPAKRETIVVER